MKKITSIQKLQWLRKTKPALWLLWVWCLFNQAPLHAQCNPDVIAPIILCPSNMTVNVNPGICSTFVNLGIPTVFDNCPGPVSIIDNAPQGNIFPLGTTTVNYTATDGAGNTAACSTNITVTGGAVNSLVCNALVTIPEDPSGMTTVYPLDILEGGPYNCVTPLISIGQNGQPAPSITINGSGTFLAVCWVEVQPGVYNKCWGELVVGNVNCTPDITPPTAVCEEVITVQSTTSGIGSAVVNATQLDDGSIDACSPTLLYRITDDLNATVPPTASTVTITGLGIHPLAMWVGDNSGNWNPCITNVTLIPGSCNPDIVPPVCIAPPNMSLSIEQYQALNINLQDSLQMIAAFGAVQCYDNCTTNPIIFAAYHLVVYANGDPKVITRDFLCIDQAGLTSTATQNIYIGAGLTSIHIPAWYVQGNAGIDSLYVTAGGPELLAVSYSDLVYTDDCFGEVNKIIRTHNILDWSQPFSNTPYILPSLDVNNDGISGDAYNVTFSGDSLWLVVNGQLIQSLAPKVALYEYIQEIRFNYTDTVNASVQGIVYLDADANCLASPSEALMANWKVKVTGYPSGTVYSGFTNTAGAYDIPVCRADSSLEVSLDAPFNYSGACPMTYNYTFVNGQVINQDIPVNLVSDCPLLTVDLTTQRIRPCNLDYYQVNYCNAGTTVVDNIQVVVQLDTFLQYINATIPGTSLGNNTWQFNIGTLNPGICGSFGIGYQTDCNTPFGITHCSEAYITPDTMCAQFNAQWMGSYLTAEGQCEGDSVRLTLRNIGTGDMTNALEFIVVEDFIMYMPGTPFLLPANGDIDITVPANGKTWRIQTAQEPGHPWQGTVAAFVEGCTGFQSSGAALAFPMSNSNPFEAIDCMVNVNSFDPNDKQAVPTGYGTEHFIEANTPIDYTIRFQNTGTDTAYQVTILDTISPYLDIRSVTPGASSHTYDFDILEGNVLRFRFDNILLPDSSDNAAASQGFVKYAIRQNTGNKDGDVLLNSAAIYFDNNAPVLTNTTFHTIGSDFIAVTTQQPTGANALKIYPNPAGTGAVHFEMPAEVASGYFTLNNTTGARVAARTFNSNHYAFERTNLPPGVYYYQIRTNNNQYFSGRIILR